MVITVSFPGTGTYAELPEHHPNPLMNPHVAMVVLKQTINWVIYFENPEEMNARLGDDRLVYGMHVYLGFHNDRRVVVQRFLTVLPPNKRVELLKDVDVTQALNLFYVHAERFKNERDSGVRGWKIKNPLFSKYDSVLVEPMEQKELNTHIKNAIAIGIDAEEFERTDFYYVTPTERADEIERMVLDNAYVVQSTSIH